MKFKMQTEWPQMPERKKVELQHILGMLQKFMPYDRAILYGFYAGGSMRSELKGYELLLITCAKPEKEGWMLESQLNQLYRHGIREESNIHIETACIHDINNAGNKSWFYTCVRDQGVILYDNSRAQPIFYRPGFKSSVAFKESKRRFDYFFGIGSDLLDEAERLWSEGKSQMASIQMSYAALFLLRAEENEYFGNQISTSNLQEIFKRCRHFSRELLNEFDLKDEKIVNFFQGLTELRRLPSRDSNYDLKEHNYEFYLRRLRRLQEIIRTSCQGHLFFLEHGKSERQMRLEAEKQADSLLSEQADNLAEMDDKDIEQ